jgi:Protein of unknown function (DUF1579)
MDFSRTLLRLCVVVSVLATPTMAQPGAKPTDEHKILASEEGTWDGTIKSFMGGPDAEPMISKGTEVNTVMSGGLWVLSKFDGDFGGMKFEGRGQFGYDPVKKKYVGTWIDSLSPNLSVLEGSYDPKTKTMTYIGDGTSAEGIKYTQKMVTTAKDDDSRVFTLYMKVGEAKDEAKFLEITYTKRK